MSSEEREQIVEAMLDLVNELGYEATSLEAVLDRAGVERAAFASRFNGLHDCYLQMFAEFTEDFDRAVYDGFDRPGPWADRLRAAAYGAARYIRDHPREAAFSSTQMLSAGEFAQALRVHHLERLVDLIDAGRLELEDPASVSRAVAEGILGSIYELATRRIGEGTSSETIESLVPDLMYLAVRPYLGHEAALRELAIPPPRELAGEAR